MSAADSAAQTGPVSVTLAKVEKGALPLTMDAIGSVQPLASVQMRTRVDAQVDAVNAADGAQVQRGQLVIKLDSRQIEAEIKQAKAQLERDQANLEQNARDVVRYRELVAQKATPQVTYDNAVTAEKAGKAAIAADQAALENLNVQLSYYSLYAPISGRIGVVTLKPGNLARAADATSTGVLATIHQVSPIYVAFTLPQRALPDLREAMANGSATVSAKPQGGAHWVEGKIDHIDNAIDPATGMMVARAVFANADEALWPGQLCDVRVQLRVDPDLAIAPREAVQTGQKGDYVFLADGDKAKLQPVKILREQNGRAAIAEGLQPGQTIIVDGANLLSEGAPIRAKSGDVNKSAN